MSRNKKMMLQELCVHRGWAPPTYSSTKQGPDHVPQFSATVIVNSFSFASQAFFCSKKEAENCAAGIALNNYFVPQSQPLPSNHNSNSLSSPCKQGFTGVLAIYKFNLILWLLTLCCSASQSCCSTIQQCAER